MSDKQSSGQKTSHGKVTKPLVSRTSHAGRQHKSQALNHKKQAHQRRRLRKNTVNSGAASRGSFKSDRKRFFFVWFITGLCFAALFTRVFYIQVLNAGFYQEKGAGLITSTRTQPAYRGMIVDRNNHPLAISAPLETVVFSPYDYAKQYYYVKKQLLNKKNSIKEGVDSSKEIEALEKQLKELDLSRLAAASHYSLDKLKQITGIEHDVDVNDEKAVKENLPKGSGSRRLVLLNKVMPEIADAVMAEGFFAVNKEVFFQRYYPQPLPNAALIGFMSESDNGASKGYQGRTGIEKAYQDTLAGSDGKVFVLKDARQNSLKEIKQIQPEIAGKDVKLTIDSRLQYLLYRELEKIGRLQSARWSSGMVVDVQTGDVLAMSMWPSFNPNNLSGIANEHQANRTVQDMFEPGSVMKPFTVAAALSSGRYSENSLIDTSPGSLRIKGYTIRDHGNLGRINFATLLQKSSNVASAKIALSLPPETLSNMQRQFGFGHKTSLNLPGELDGKIPTPSESQTDLRATMSYGYGIQVTLAQLAQAYATLASGGIMHPLRVVKSDKPVEGYRVIEQHHANSIVQMLEKVTQPGGTAKTAAIDGYRVAGKTGTSRRNNPKGGYYTDQYRTVFAGIAPVSDPRLVVVILVEDPQKQHYAGQVAAPVFHNVMQEALRLYNVPLDKPLKK